MFCKLILIIFMIFLFLQCVSTVIIVYIIISPLNSYLYIHWILDFINKYYYYVILGPHHKSVISYLVEKVMGLYNLFILSLLA